MALGLIFTGCSCSKDSGKTNTTSNNTATTNASTTNSTNATNSTDTANNSIVGTWKYDKGLDYDADFSYTFNPDKRPLSYNELTKEQFDAEMLKGMDDIENNRVYSADQVEADIRGMYSC